MNWLSEGVFYIIPFFQLFRKDGRPHILHLYKINFPFLRFISSKNPLTFGASLILTAPFQTNGQNRLKETWGWNNSDAFETFNMGANQSGRIEKTCFGEEGRCEDVLCYCFSFFIRNFFWTETSWYGFIIECFLIVKG